MIDRQQQRATDNDSWSWISRDLSISQVHVRNNNKENLYNFYLQMKYIPAIGITQRRRYIYSVYCI